MLNYMNEISSKSHFMRFHLNHTSCYIVKQVWLRQAGVDKNFLLYS